MAKVDEVTVQPLTTYMEGAEHKNERSDPYRVPRWQGSELEALGYARIISGEPAEAVEPASEDGRADVGNEATITHDGKPRGRRGGARV